MRKVFDELIVENNEEIAVNLIKRNKMSDAEIAEDTGLTEERILQLKEGITKKEN